MVNKDKVEAAVKLLLEGMGEDVNREGLKETPARVARMYEELLSGMGASAKEHLSKTFEASDSQIVLERDITFYSVCEHHLMPFFGKIHIAYIPDGQVVGISKLARTVEVYAAWLQIQERLTAEIADAIMENLRPKGVMVLVSAEHMCMTMRGVKKPGSQTVTAASRGLFDEDESLKSLFWNMVK
ncbi:MAG: GTP cyclohydrolase I FolE [Lachnospiraceae bacterium]|nr:GTP cyclohydrolase I FolE [Lachnospiraceae bacterium]